MMPRSFAVLLHAPRVHSFLFSAHRLSNHRNEYFIHQHNRNSTIKKSLTFISFLSKPWRQTKESDRNLAGASEQGQTQSHGEERKKMRAMVAIDDSKESFYALKWALDHLFTASPAAGVDQSHPPESNQLVTLVHVMEPLPHYTYPGGYVVETATKGLENKATKMLSRASELCKENNVSAEMIIVSGDPKQMLCETAEKMAVDVLVVGSRGLGQIKRALLGSVSDYCAHQARCPVLIVKLPKSSAN